MNKYTVSSTLLSTVVLSVMVLESPVSAEATTKVNTVTSATSKISESGKLVSKKTGKSLKGYKRYNNKMYFKGILFSGILNKNYYKAGSKATAVYKHQYFKKGILSTGVYKNVYYVKGKVANGVYKNVYYIKGKVANGVYKNVYYVKGKVANGVYKNIYYVKGKVANGVYKNVYYVKGKVANGVYKNIYYVKGKVANGVYKELYYVKGKLFTGKANNVQYVEGVNTGAYEVEDKLLIREFFVIDIENELPEYVQIKKSDETLMETPVTWQVQSENKDVLEINKNIIQGTKSGNYFLIGSIPNSTFKPKLKIFIGSYNDIYQQITIDLLLKDEVIKILDKSKNEKVMQTSFSTEFNQLDFSTLIGSSEATDMLRYAGFINQNMTNNSDTPTNNSDTPTNNSDIPTNNSDIPTNNSDTPTNNSDTPTNNSDTPTNNLDISINGFNLFVQDLELSNARSDVYTILKEKEHSIGTLNDEIIFAPILIPNTQFPIPVSLSLKKKVTRMNLSIQNIQQIINGRSVDVPIVDTLSNQFNRRFLNLGLAALDEMKKLEPINSPVPTPKEEEMGEEIDKEEEMGEEIDKEEEMGEEIDREEEMDDIQLEG